MTFQEQAPNTCACVFYTVGQGKTICSAFPGLEVWASRREADPLRTA